MRDQSAETGSDQRDADVVAGIQQRHADQPADDPRADHPDRVGRADERTGHQPAEDESREREHEAKQLEAEEARHRATDDERNRECRLILNRQHQRSRRPSIALVIVTSSAYSRSDPTGIPIAMRVTRTPSGLSSRAR